MKRRRVQLDLHARRDLDQLHDYIADHGGPQTAQRYLARVRRHLSGFDMASERGTLREDIAPGLRTIGFERRLTIIFRVSEQQVEIIRVLYGGRDVEEALIKAAPPA